MKEWLKTNILRIFFLHLVCRSSSLHTSSLLSLLFLPRMRCSAVEQSKLACLNRRPDRVWTMSSPHVVWKGPPHSYDHQLWCNLAEVSKLATKWEVDSFPPINIPRSQRRPVTYSVKWERQAGDWGLSCAGSTASREGAWCACENVQGSIWRKCQIRSTRSWVVSSAGVALGWKECCSANDSIPCMSSWSSMVQSVAPGLETMC